MRQLSILIPNRNYDCLKLVSTLQKQSEHFPGGLEYDITVVDDGSDGSNLYDPYTQLKGIQIEKCLKARNRSAMRNRLATFGRYEWMLMVNSNVQVRDQSFLEHLLYDITEPDTILCALCKADADTSNLRCLDERETRVGRFRNTCYLTHRKVWKEVQYDEGIENYGMEDVLLGAELKGKGYKIKYVDATVWYDASTSNEQYVQQVEESMRTLRKLEPRLREEVRLLVFIKRHWYLCQIWRLAFRLLKTSMRTNLTGQHPNVRLLPLYKLGYYMTECE